MQGSLVRLILCLTLSVSFVVVSEAQQAAVRAIIEPTERPGLELWLDKDCYEAGESLVIHFKSEKGGYLTLYSIDSAGNVSVLFPNAFYSSPRINGGVTYSLPASGDPFRIVVQPPPGATPGDKEIIWGVITEKQRPLPTAKGMDPEQWARTVRVQLESLPSSIWWASKKVEFRYGPCGGEESKGEVYALLVAISDYADDRNDLDYPISQNIIRAYREVLGKFFDHVKVLDDEEATRSRILQGIRGFLGQAGPEDIVYFHFAGHGYHVRDKNGDEKENDPADRYDEIICPYDIKVASGKLTNVILDDEICDTFASLRAGRAVLVFESCYSGTVHRGGEHYNVFSLPCPTMSELLVYPGGTMADDFSKSRSYRGGPKVLALEACGPTQSAYYVNKPDGLSVFAFFMLRVLEQFREEADTNGDGWVSLQEVFKLAAPAVSETIEEEVGEEQDPMMFDYIKEPVNVKKVR